MSQILLDIPEDSLLALRVSVAQMGEELRMAGAVKLFELGRLSAGAAAELAAIPKPLFLLRLADYGVAAFRHSVDELRGTWRMPEIAANTSPLQLLFQLGLLHLLPDF